MVVTVNANAGPFTVTTPNANVSWVEGSQHIIKWNVANTNVAPVNCSHVNILLSLDGGNTFPINLKSNIANDGVASVILPMNTTTQARIKIAAADNIFYDISNTNFRITTAGKPENSIASNLNVAAKIISVQPNPANAYTNVVFNTALKNCTLVLTDADGKVVLNKTINSISKGATEKISLQQFTKGVYFLKISSGEHTQTEKIIVD